MKQSDRELAESNSEDERIRKSLIRNFTNQHSSNFPTADGFTREQILAWLEKQGEPSLEVIHEPKFKKGHWIVSHYNNDVVCIQSNDKKYYNLLLLDGYHEKLSIDYVDRNFHLWSIDDAKDGDVLATSNYIYIFNSIDKETETVAYYCLMKKSDEYFSFGDYKIHDEILNSIPATKKQRNLLFQKMKESGYEWNADKKELNTIESKFNASDWVVNKNGTVQQILSYKNGIYKHTNGYSSKMFEDEWRLWDITKDAKDGDVLATDDGNICIFDGTFKDGKYPFAYCGLTRHRFEFYDRRLPFTHNNIYPATKEQYDTLMKAMADAGYTFDFEKKEVKKIPNA